MEFNKPGQFYAIEIARYHHFPQLYSCLSWLGKLTKPRTNHRNRGGLNNWIKEKYDKEEEEKKKPTPEDVS